MNSPIRGGVALAVVFALAASTASGAQPPAPGAAVSGTATTSAGQTVANATVQLRDLATGQIIGSTTSSATGAFTFTGLAAGTVTVEVVGATGAIIGTSASIAVAAGATITGVTVSAVAAVAGVAAGAAAAAGAAVAGAAGGIAGLSTALVISSVAAAAGVAGAVAVATSASPSR